jgi:hypothetical protein
MDEGPRTTQDGRRRIEEDQQRFRFGPFWVDRGRVSFDNGPVFIDNGQISIDGGPISIDRGGWISNDEGWVSNDHGRISFDDDWGSSAPRTTCALASSAASWKSRS